MWDDIHSVKPEWRSLTHREGQLLYRPAAAHNFGRLSRFVMLFVKRYFVVLASLCIGQTFVPYRTFGMDGLCSSDKCFSVKYIWLGLIWVNPIKNCIVTTCTHCLLLQHWYIALSDRWVLNYIICFTCRKCHIDYEYIILILMHGSCSSIH
jgi:hypothetical protein